MNRHSSQHFLGYKIWENIMQHRTSLFLPGADWMWGCMGASCRWAVAWRSSAIWWDRRWWTTVCRTSVTWGNHDTWQGKNFGLICVFVVCTHTQNCFISHSCITEQVGPAVRLAVHLVGAWLESQMGHDPGWSFSWFSLAPRAMFG
jgi:hypothetical protein